MKASEAKKADSQKLASSQIPKKRRLPAAERAAVKEAQAQKRVEAVGIVAPDGGLPLVFRRVDTVMLLYRQGRIDARQRAAADDYLLYTQQCQGSIPCALDQSRVRGGGGIAVPSETQLRAAQKLAEASRVLGMIDSALVSLVVVEGHTVQGAARRMYGGKAGQRLVLHVGRRLSDALAALADHWYPPHRARLAGRRYVETDDHAHGDVVEPGRVAHATARRVYGYDEPRRSRKKTS